MRTGILEDPIRALKLKTYCRDGYKEVKKILSPQDVSTLGDDLALRRAEKPDVKMAKKNMLYAKGASSTAGVALVLKTIGPKKVTHTSSFSSMTNIRSDKKIENGARA